jgi:DHA2 family multidrug resistance protein
MSALPPGAGSAGAAPPAPPAAMPWLGLFAVLLGTFISTLNGRLSTFGLSDIRGAVHAGFGEGSWITTASTVAQMLIAPVAVWAGGVYGSRRMLLWAAAAFAGVSAIEPLATNLPALLLCQFCGGLASGFFVPLTLSFILRSMPPKTWAWGVAVYALNLELSLNISASLEGWYVEHLSWMWIFWQNVPLALGMVLCLRFGAPADPPPDPERPPADWFGLAVGGLGFALIYAALDQGNRLDWLNSGLVVGLLASGGILLVGFFIHEARTPYPAVDLKVALAAPLPTLLVLIGFVRLTILSTAYLIPQYLGAVRVFRALEVGQTLIWIAAPQLVICPLAAVLLRRIDARILASIGFFFIGVACLLVSRGLTPVWGSGQFLPTQLLQAVGQSFALSGIVFFGILHLRPQDALTFGGAVQTARLMGGQIGSAFVTTLVRVRSQTASNHIGLHVQAGAGDVAARLQAYAAASAPGDPAVGPGRAVGILSGVVRGLATTQGVIDTFAVISGLSAVALMLVVAHKAAPPGPASHVSLFGPPKAPAS